MKNVKLLSQIVLREGISHIEDLPLREFIRTVESMQDKVITEKLDGANLWFGIDNRGLFTSREGKSSRKTRFYKLSDYPVVAAYNGFRGAHLAIEKAESIIRKYLKEGDTVEIEVLFGRQPNTVTYGVEGKNFIVVLRGVNNTPEERVQNLAAALNNKQYTVKSTIVSSSDGESLQNTDEDMVWEFTKVEPISGSKIKTEAVAKILNALKKYAQESNKVFSELTNGEISEINLSSIPKDKRAMAKSERDRVNEYIMNTFKTPIKEQLLDKFVRKIKPMLQDPELHPSEDVGVEGVVLRDPVTGSQTKIVDKDVFTAINSFNSAVRANISGLVRTADEDAPIESRGGAFGVAKIKIANLLGEKDLAVSSTAKRLISKYKKSDAYATSLALAQGLNVKNVSGLRTKISSLLRKALEEVNGILGEFKQDAGEFKLQLKTGKEIGISPEVMKRTLTAFAETKKEINDINRKVLASRTPADIMLALYGRTISSLFSEGDSEVSESYNLIKSINEDDSAGAGDGATTSGGIATHPEHLFHGGKVVIKRQRNFARPMKFPKPKSSYSLIKSVNEDMEFATDVDDTARAGNDVEFNQLRNNVNMGDSITQMDVSRYLDKAHEINDQVDTVAFGLETSDKKIVKVYVNATQAIEFEKAMAQLLGQQADVEKSINDLALRFDIVDVEWPQEEVPSADGIPGNDPTVNTELSFDDENPEIDLSTFGEEGPEFDDEEGEGEESSDGNVEGEESESSEEDSDEESEDEEDEDEDERNDFGEIVPKKGKKKEDDDEEKDEPSEEESEDDESEDEEDSDEESEDEEDEESDEEKTEESLNAIGALLNKLVLLEADGEALTFANPAMQAVSDMLVALGFDLTASRSFAAQAKMLQGRNTPGLMAAKHLAVASKIAIARDALSKAIKLSPGAPTQQNQSYQLLGYVLEAQDKWMIGDLKDLGIQISTSGMIIKLSPSEAGKLNEALKNHKSIVVTSTNSKQFNFDAASDNGYVVHEKDKETIAKEMTAEEVAKVIETISAQ